ncbi:transcription intermediary factor 1-beta-like isoform X1 [Erpetoichthys calabaricus]|uniref:transcription intermediary factor 1-beta-like isoform X1 n=1 Tax=Erpetoichthys calabaricus TaxID=27687 RepID=UPI0022348758|nr:transcription intermediary factor 1-beta-like isoform X1 [Erpetoichthys calabaricus]
MAIELINSARSYLDASFQGAGGVSSSSSLFLVDPEREALLESCGICRTKLQLSREPKLLPCLHSLCKQCLPSNSASEWMQCPVCKQTFQLHDVVENYFIRDTPSSSKSNGNKTKEVCICCEDKAEASSFCIDCSEWLCDACVGAHQRVKITKDHTVRRREEGADSAAATGVTPDRLLFCPAHRHEPLKIFCVTCEVLTCRDCQLHDHKDHKYQFLENAIPEQRLILENILKHLQECTYGVRKSARNLRSMIKELKEVERRVKMEIRMAIHSLMKELNKRGTFLAQEVQKHTEDQQHKLEQQHWRLIKLQRHQEHILRFLSWVLRTDNNTALLFYKKMIFSQIQRSMKPGENPENALLNIQFQWDVNLWTTNVQHFGKVITKDYAPGSHPAFTNSEMESKATKDSTEGHVINVPMKNAEPLKLPPASSNLNFKNVAVSKPTILTSGLQSKGDTSKHAWSSYEKAASKERPLTFYSLLTQPSTTTTKQQPPNSKSPSHQASVSPQVSQVTPQFQVPQRTVQENTPQSSASISEQSDVGNQKWKVQGENVPLPMAVNLQKVNANVQSSSNAVQIVKPTTVNIAPRQEKVCPVSSQVCIPPSAMHIRGVNVETASNRVVSTSFPFQVPVNSSSSILLPLNTVLQPQQQQIVFLQQVPSLPHITVQQGVMSNVPAYFQPVALPAAQSQTSVNNQSFQVISTSEKVCQQKPIVETPNTHVMRQPAIPQVNDFLLSSLKTLPPPSRINQTSHLPVLKSTVQPSFATSQAQPSQSHQIVHVNAARNPGTTLLLTSGMVLTSSPPSLATNQQISSQVTNSAENTSDTGNYKDHPLARSQYPRVLLTRLKVDFSKDCEPPAFQVLPEKNGFSYRIFPCKGNTQEKVPHCVSTPDSTSPPSDSGNLSSGSTISSAETSAVFSLTPLPFPKTAEQRDKDSKDVQTSKDGNEKKEAKGPRVDGSMRCASCRTRGQLSLCCECGKGFHQECHIPPLLRLLSSADWKCMLCRDFSDVGDQYKSEFTPGNGETKAASLSLPDQRKCEHLLLMLFCDKASAYLFKPNVPASAPEKYTDLTLIRGRLLRKISPPYEAVDDFIRDVWLLLGNVLKYSQNPEITKVVTDLQLSFSQKLMDVFAGNVAPDFLKPLASKATLGKRINADSLFCDSEENCAKKLCP